MTTSWDRIRAVLEGALERDAGAPREAWIDAACGGDEALASEVRRLLAEDASRTASTAFLEPPSADDLGRALAPSAPVSAGARVGRYELLRVLGAGGMGTVWEARQENPRRTVALKMLAPALASASARRRFASESEILARLRHPGIAAVHDVGVHAVGGLEVPYYVMELVEDARPIVAWAREHELDLAARLGLFREVCAAVHHGHERGVVHRDLKPGNILVDGAGAPRVIDFGVARLLASDGEASLATRTGQILGTLRYMSPEQLAGDPDAVGVRSDVYALGVVLYELVCDRMPYDVDTGRSLLSAAEVVSRAPPHRPSTARPELSGDVEAVLLMALEKDPADRYASAAALAEDLRRLLAKEPVSARPPSTWRLLRAGVRRHRVLAAASVAVLLVLVAATAVSLRFGWRAEREAERAQRAQTSAEDASHEAQRERDAALAARDAESAARERAETLLSGTLGLSTRFLSAFFDRVSGLSGSPELNRELLATVLGHLDALAARGEGGAEQRFLEAACRMRLGDVLGGADQANLGRLADAEREYRAALGLSGALHDEFPDEPRFLVQHADAHLALAGFAGVQDRPAEALELAERALRLLDEAVARWPDVPHHRLRRCDALQHLATSLARVGEASLAQRHADEWDVECDRLLAIDAASRDHRKNKVACLDKLADFALDRGDLETSEGLRVEQQALLEGLVADAPDDTSPRASLGTCLEWRSNLAMRRGEADAALALAREAVATFERLVADAPGDTRFPRQLGYSVFNLGEAFHMRAVQEDTAAARADAWAEARACYERSRAVYVRLRDEGRLVGRDLDLPEEIAGFVEQAVEGERMERRQAASEAGASVD